jgi:hypothetical protein
MDNWERFKNVPNALISAYSSPKLLIGIFAADLFVTVVGNSIISTLPNMWQPYVQIVADSTAERIKMEYFIKCGCQ